MFESNRAKEFQRTLDRANQNFDNLFNKHVEGETDEEFVGKMDGVTRTLFVGIERTIQNVKIKMADNWMPGVLDWAEEILINCHCPDKVVRNKSEGWVELPYDDTLTIMKGLANSMDDQIGFIDAFRAQKKALSIEVWDKERGWFSFETLIEGGKTLIKTGKKMIGIGKRLKRQKALAEKGEILRVKFETLDKKIHVRVYPPKYVAESTSLWNKCSKPEYLLSVAVHDSKGVSLWVRIPLIGKWLHRRKYASL